MLNQIQQLGVKVMGLGAIVGLTILGSISSASAAETVILKYGIFSSSIPVDDLTSYARGGSEPSGGIASLLKAVTSEDRPSVMKLLDTQFPFGVLQVDQIIKSPVGDKFLNELAAATILPGESEVKALRSAALVTAAEDKALSFGGMLKRYPTPTLTVNLPVLLKTFKANGPTLGALIGRSGGNFSPPPTNLPQ
jgi:hypothetical protein